MSEEQKSNEQQECLDELQERQDGRREKMPRKRKALWLVAALACVAALVLGVQLTLGAFTANDFLKAVAVTGTSQDLFASDVLAPYSNDPGDSPVLRSIVVDKPGACSFTFRIYNCLLDDTNVFNDKEVTYTLSVTAKDASDKTIDSRKWSINPAADTHTFSVTRGEIMPYTITLDSDLVDKASFLIKATVVKDKSPGTSKACLAARIAPVNRSDAKAASVSGSWVDKDGDNAGDYAAYNYRITVTGEKKRVTLTWGSKVGLDSHFKTNHADAVINGHSATFDVEPGSEIVNFYRAGSNVPTSWEDLGVKVEEAKS